MITTLHTDSLVRTPINEYQGKYPCLTITAGGTVLLWHERQSLTVLVPGDPRMTGWVVGEYYTPSEDEIEEWGSGTTVVVEKALTITFNTEVNQ